MIYTASFVFINGNKPKVGAGDSWLGGSLCRVSFSDEFYALEKLRQLAEAIANGDGDPQEMAIQTLELLDARRA